MSICRHTLCPELYLLPAKEPEAAVAYEHGNRGIEKKDALCLFGVFEDASTSFVFFSFHRHQHAPILIAKPIQSL